MVHFWSSIARTLAAQRFRSPVAVENEVRVGFRVRALDCDGLRVMSAMRYPAYMDLARWEIIARSGMLRVVLRDKLAPVMGAQKLIHRRPLRRGERFDVRVYPAGWDEKWMYHVHLFERRGAGEAPVALGLTKLRFWRRDVVAPLPAFLSELGASEIERPPPDWVARSFSSDQEDLRFVAGEAI